MDIGPDLLEIFENIPGVRFFFETQCNLFLLVLPIQLPSQPESITAPWPVPNYTAW